ncbi:hypothetical protein [Alkalilimnicola ehrlichii]|nr:hypothetical protein [Alkalilimnicola ehrlichii]
MLLRQQIILVSHTWALPVTLVAGRGGDERILVKDVVGYALGGARPGG